MLDLVMQDGAVWFTVPALAGTTVFVFRLILMLLGVVGHDLAPDFHVGAADAHHGDSSDAFKLLSIQSVSANSGTYTCSSNLIRRELLAGSIGRTGSTTDHIFFDGNQQGM